uniref:transposase n=1 Tax=Brachybacterium huguangmaarense TaxID=1652028 RepID=UPI002963F06A|nr:transposase [Brachybacterium huguangmaarense]
MTFATEAARATLGHRGRKGDPFYGIRHLLRAGCERLTSCQQNRLASAFAPYPDHVAVEVAYQCAQDVREVFHQPTLPRGRRLAEQLIEKLPSCLIPEIARLGKTLRRWRTAFLAYFDTDGASNGGTAEAINGIIELGRRIARGFRNFEHYRLRMLLITGGLDASPHTQL